MVAKSLKWALAGLIACPAVAFALGLGDIHLLSTLNAPLDADIDIVGATPDELSTLKPHIASRETFAAHGLDWPAFLADVTVTAVHTADGRDILKLHSTEPITEPFVTLLVEVDYDRGRWLREYTMLLDPPVYTPNQSAVAQAPVSAPATGSAANAGQIARAAAAAPSESAPSATTPNATAASTPAPSAAAPEAAAPAAPASAAVPSADTYEVHRGDSLSRIAVRLTGASLRDAERWMIAAYQANPSAFDHNMNLLRAGVVLRVPSASDVDSVSAADARAEVHRQYVAWRGESHAAARPESESGRLRLVTPGENPVGAGEAGAGASASANPGVKALQARVQELEGELDQSKRLIDMKNAELAQLQAKLGTHETATPATPATPASAASRSVEASAAPAEQAQASAPASQPSASAPPPPPASASAAPPAAALAAPAAHKPLLTAHPVRHHPPSAPKSSWLDSIMRLWWIAALALAGALGYLSFRAWSARRRTGFDDSLGRLAEAGAAALSAGRDGHTQPSSAQIAPHREDNFLVEESGTREVPRFDGAAPAPSAPRHVASDGTISAETAINLDQGDPLAEADFHMAYGLYDQAADLVRIAVQREPERRDLKLKLLEVYFVWGNKEQFLQMAHELAETRPQAAPGEWEKIVIMGKQLAPDDPLFAGAAAVSGAAAGGVDLDLVGGQQGVDFDILGEPVTASTEGVDLDIGTAVGERDHAAELAAQQATDQNVALHEDGGTLHEATSDYEPTVQATREMTREMTKRLDTATGVTREMTRAEPGTATTRQMPRGPDGGTLRTQQMTAVMGGAEHPQEPPTVEQPALAAREPPSVRQKLASALRQGGASEHTTEVAIDDLGLDLSGLDGGAGVTVETVTNEALTPAAQDTVDQPGFGGAADTPTLVAGLDEQTRRVMMAAERRSAAADSELKVSSTGTWHFQGDNPFAETEIAPAPGNGHAGAGLDTAHVAALKSSRTVDFDLGGATLVRPAATANASANAGGVDLDVGTATVPDVVFTATQRLGNDDLALPDLEPVTMSEVGTKLDLARAYMDMGDPEGARNILEEVLNEGSVAQKQEAQRLIASLPG